MFQNSNLFTVEILKPAIFRQIAPSHVVNTGPSNAKEQYYEYENATANSLGEYAWHMYTKPKRSMRQPD